MKVGFTKYFLIKKREKERNGDTETKLENQGEADKMKKREIYIRNIGRKIVQKG